MSEPSVRFECSSPVAVRHDEQDLHARVEAEFQEMPGLMLTLPQAARLFSLDPARCERVLGALVHAGRLATNGRLFAIQESGRRSA